MLNDNQLILLDWYKGSEDSPWVVAVEDSNENKHEITIGEKGYASAGPRLTNHLKYMNSQIHRYPMRYDMRLIRNKEARIVEGKVLNQKVTYIETTEAYKKEILKSFTQTPFTPIEEKVSLIEDARYIQSPTKENSVISKFSTDNLSTNMKEIKNKAKMLRAYEKNTNVFWLFMEGKNVKINSSDEIEGFISSYSWPEGYIVPEYIGNQNILDSQRTVNINLLGLSSFDLTGEQLINKTKAYNIQKNNAPDTSILEKVEVESKEYLESFIDNNSVIAVSLEYSKDENQPIENNSNLLGIVYKTPFTSISEVDNAIENKEITGVNLNKSLLKESYSSMDEVRQDYTQAYSLPLVEYNDHGIPKSSESLAKSDWIKEVGAKAPRTFSLQNTETTQSIQTFSSNTKTSRDEEYDKKIADEEAMIEEMVEEQVKEDGLLTKDHYVEGYVNNDLAFVPPKDDRLESGEIYSQIYIENEEEDNALPYDYTHKVRIGDVIMEVPPLSIKAEKEQANQSVPTLRSRNSLQRGVAHSRQVLTLDLYFHDLDNINGHKYHVFTRKNGEEVHYYMDGLRSLLAQFIKSPFVPIDNYYINNSLGVNNVAMRDIQASTIQGFPEAVAVTLTLEEVDLGAYMMGEANLGSLMNYPLYRWYYQQALNGDPKDYNNSVQLPALKSLDNRFSFRVADEDFLNKRSQTIREFNNMKKPRDFKRELEKDYEKEKGKNNKKELEDAKGIQNALSEFANYQKYYNGLPSNIKSKYKKSELPIITRPGSDINLRHGESGPIPEKEYEIALKAGREVYKNEFNDEPNQRMSQIDKRRDYQIGFETTIHFMFIGSYQLAKSGYINKLIFDNDIPGVIQVYLKDNDNRKKFNNLFDKLLDFAKKKYPNEEAELTKYHELGKGIFYVPLGKVGGIDFIAELNSLISERVEEVDKKVDEYTTRYNAMADVVNVSEDEIPMHEVRIDDIIPLSLNVGISNNLSMVQSQSGNAPSLQYLGGQQPEVQLSFSTTDEGVKQIDKMFRLIGRYAKEHRVGIVSNFMEIINPLVNMFGIRAVLPNVFNVETVENQPNEKIVTMTLVGFDKTQRRQEAINSFAGGKTTKNLWDLHLKEYDPQVNALYVHEKIKTTELYPDLDLPTYSELEEDLEYLDSGVGEFENRRGQVFLDPDFYVSTKRTMRKELNDILGDKRSTEIKYKDDLGVEATTNGLTQEGIVLSSEMENTVNEIDKNNKIVDPFLVWQGYGEGESGEDQEVSGAEDELVGDSANGYLNGIRNRVLQKYLLNNDGSINFNEPSKKTLSAWGVKESLEDIKKGEGNPSTVDVHQHLMNEVKRVFDIKPIADKGIKNLLRNKFNKEKVKQIKIGPTPVLISQFEIAKYPLKGSYEWDKELKNGIIKKINYEHNAGEALKHNFSKAFFGIGGRDVIDFDIYSYKNSDGESYFITQTPLLRVFMYAKTLIDMESNWKHFDKDGKPFVSEIDDKGRPLKVGITGVPMNEVETTKEAQRILWDWKYNITYAVEQLKETFITATENIYQDFHLRGMAWAVAKHSGRHMPIALEYPGEDTDQPFTEKNLPIAPESLRYFIVFNKFYERNVNELNKDDAVQIYKSPDGVNREALGEDLNKNKEEAKEVEEESEIIQSRNFDKYTLKEKIKHMYIDMEEYNHVGRLVRAFPSFSMMLIDEGKWFGNFRTWDNFYGYNSLLSIDVYKSRKIAADTATIQMSNIYGNLTSTEFNPAPDIPKFFSSRFFDHYVKGRPTEEIIESRAEVYDQVMLQTGARIHLRMGYGADASNLPVVFNGSISEMDVGETMTITAQGDAIELQNVISGDPGDDNVGFLNRVQEPRRTIGELMTSKGNWLRDVINDNFETKDFKFFKDNASGIVHFGSTVDSETGNRAILPGAAKEEFGESLQNVYSQNGMETASQWHNSDGNEITKIEMISKNALNLLTSIGGTLMGATAPFDEDNVAVSYYGRTVWEVIQTFALASQDYVSDVRPFEFRSTLFFGKPHWMMQYRYDSDFIYDSDREVIERTVTKTHNKTFMQAHVYNSFYNILTNNVRASEEGVYNNVIVTYDGRQAGPIQADSDIRIDKQRTVSVEANLLAPRAIEYFRAEDQALIYGQSTLRDYMKDMYKGEYTIIGDPAVDPYDVVYLNDVINDIHGIHLVKAVHQSITPETGFITYIEPDAYVFNFDEELSHLPGSLHGIGKNLNMSAVMKQANNFSATMVTTSLINKLAGVAASKYKSSIFADAVGYVADKKLITGINKEIVGRSYGAMGRLINPGGATANAAEAILNAKTKEAMKTATDNAAKSFARELTSKKTQIDVARQYTQGANSVGTTLQDVKFLEGASNKLIDIMANPTAQKTVAGTKEVATQVGQFAKTKILTKTFLNIAVFVGVEIATAWIGEWWNRKKQNAEAIKVVPLQHKGNNWTALMNWHKGSVLGDDPSLRDKLMNAEFFDDEIDPEINEVFGNSIFKLINLLFG